MTAYGIYLDGGPGDGHYELTETAPAQGDTYVYNDSLYTIVWPEQKHDGVTVYAYTGNVPSEVPQAARLHVGYSDIQRSVNRHMPAALSNAHRYTVAGLRSVARARKVRL